MASTTSVARGRPSDGATTNASASAMNIFEKYSSLNRGIEDTRNAMKATKDKMEEIHQAIRTSRQERASMQRDIGVAHQEANDFHQQVDQGNETIFQLQADQSRAMAEQRRAQRELEGVKAFVEEQRRQFLDRSREFRASCKRVRLRASSMGLEYAPLRAFATVNSMMADEDAHDSSPNGDGESSNAPPMVVLPSSFEENDDGMFRPAVESEGGIETVTDETSTLSDPGQWIADARDEDMKDALETYRKELASYTHAKQELEDLKAQHKKAQDQAASRAQRKQQLLAQMQRIEKDNTDMEQELVQLEQDTQESKELGRGFEKGMVLFCGVLSLSAIFVTVYSL